MPTEKKPAAKKPAAKKPAAKKPAAKKPAAKKPAARKPAAKKLAAKKASAEKPAAKRPATATRTKAAAKPATAAKKSVATPTQPKTASGDTALIFARLKSILEKYAPSLDVKDDSEVNYYLNSQKPYQKKELMFGATSVRKSYVSFYLFPIYMFPELADGLSDALQKHRQGKSCFNFKKLDEGPIEELAALTERSFQRFQQEGLT